MNKRPLWGVSTGILLEKNEYKRLLDYEPEIIEIYNYPRRMAEELVALCQKNGIAVSFHTPVPYDRKQALNKFAASGPLEHEQTVAIDLTLSTIAFAAEIAAHHVVVHYPSPFPLVESAIPMPVESRFFSAICDAARVHSVALHVENMTSHPSFYRPEDYASLFQRWPSLGMCLDVCHAHLLRPLAESMDFLSALPRQVRSCHLSSVSLLTYGRSGQRFPNLDTRGEIGELDLNVILNQISMHGETVEAIVAEGRPSRDDDWRREVKSALEIRARINSLYRT